MEPSELSKRIDSVVAELLVIKAELLRDGRASIERARQTPEESVKQASPDQLMTQDEAAAILSVEPQTLSVWRTSKRYDLP